ncbi:hypothetical protein SRABI76_03312 [Microbacterium oxydans]|uniref:hypothetical protein n=1 Tax=Microbacterium oxydans TaxID=82380 RepID=UPI001D5DD1FA|nr:hypothetical protein [Microbacterium oxydans]CAH0253893.1 hypothetical protein SRABI76_03312 [Microbacterium oxydans]
MFSASTAATTRSEFADAVTVLFLAAAALVVTGISTVMRIAGTFRDDGIAWTIPIDEQPISATADSGAVTVEGIAQEAMVFSTGVDPAATAAIIAAIALRALAAVIIIGAVALIAWSFLRERVFSRSNARALDAIGWTLVIAPTLIVMLETAGRNGVTAVLGLGAEATHPIEFWAISPFYATGVTIGLIAVALRRGRRLQQERDVLEKETEGLV